MPTGPWVENFIIRYTTTHSTALHQKDQGEKLARIHSKKNDGGKTAEPPNILAANSDAAIDDPPSQKKKMASIILH